MAKQYDYSKLPATIVIKNIGVATKAYDAGSLQKASEIFEDENNKKYAIVPATKRVQFYRTNSFIILEEGDEVTIQAKTSAELHYFLSLNSDTLEVKEAVAEPTEAAEE